MARILAILAGMWTGAVGVYNTVFGPLRRRWAAFDAWWARMLPGWRGEAASFGLWILFFFFFMPTFFYQPFHIPSASMENTLIEGDYIFVNKFAYGYSRYSMAPWSPFTFGGRIWAGEPKRGDVIVFRLPGDPSIDYIKRLIGMPGDRVQMRNGVLYLNGTAVTLTRLPDWTERNEKRAPEPVAQYDEVLPGGRVHQILNRTNNGAGDDTPEYVVPDGHYFMMGDNRDESLDSRFAWNGREGVGMVPFENLVGRADLVFFSVKADYRWWQIWRFPFAIRYDRLLNGIK